MNVLQQILDDTRERIKSRITPAAVEQMRQRAQERRAADAKPGLRASLARPGLQIIAEFKRASPSRGPIRADADPVQMARLYSRGGAAALSVLTNERHFNGSIRDLERTAAAVDLPVLRKEFIVHHFQIYEAAAVGADGVLLIAAALSVEQLENLLREARSLALDALVEVHDLEELKKTVAAGATLIGINNRDLVTFQVDLKCSLELSPRVPDGITRVSESGIRTRGDVVELESAGFDALLIGEELMRSADPVARIRELRGL